MDQKILNQLLEELQSIKKGMLTKDDSKNFATKDDLKNFATKDDLKNFATKDDLKNFATKDDLKNFATKDDLETAIKPLVTTKHFDYVIRNAVVEVTLNADKHKADKESLEVLEQRVEHLEQKVFA